MCLFHFFVPWDNYNCIQLWTGLNTTLLTFEPLLNHFSSLLEGEKVSLVLFPRKARGQKSLSPAGCPPSSRAPSLLLSLLFFPHASLPKTNSTRLPTQIFGIPGQPYICLCFGQEHVLNCLLQHWRKGRWLNLPFSTGLNPACNTTLGKGAISQLPLCVCGVCGKEFAEKWPSFPKFPAGEEQQSGPGCWQPGSARSCV